MSVGGKVKALLQSKGKGAYDLAKCFEISAQAARNKLSRSSFSADDLIRIAKYLDCELSFNTKTGTVITLDADDIRE